jgi:hypothetical protein
VARYLRHRCGVHPSRAWELSAKVDVRGCLSLSRPNATSTESSGASSRSWLRRVLFAPGRVFFLAVLSLMELFGLPKVKQLPPSGRGEVDSPEGAG